MWSDPIGELRTLLDDGDQDKLRFNKAVIGDQDGVNVTFKTFEFRRITDLSNTDVPFGVYVNGTLATVNSDFPESGVFILDEAPVQSDKVVASYYVKFFLDSELNQFITNACKWLLSVTDPNQVPVGLQPAALKYAASEAYQKLSTRFINHLSETYRLEDVPDENQRQFVKDLQDTAMKYVEEAAKARDEFYTRQGQSEQPLFATIPGAVSDNVPIR